jgi:hypothetical protein
MKVHATTLRNGGRGAAVAALVVGLGLIAVNSIAYVGFIAAAFVPMFVAAMLEKPGFRSATICIGSMTMATVLPIVLQAIADGNQRGLLLNPTAWTFVGAAVMGGIGVYFILPTVTLFLDDMKAKARVRALRARQEALERDWGPEVRSTIAN